MNDITILRSREQIEDATMAQLVATYNALTGRTEDGEGTKRCVRKFESREVGKRRVEQAMMAAEDADAHLGVAKGANGEVKTADELADKARGRGAEAPDMTANGTITFPDGTLANKLQEEAKASPGPITPRPRKDAQPKKERDPNAPPPVRASKFTHVAFAPPEAAKSKVRPDSARGVVLAGMTSLMKGKAKAISIEALEKHIGSDPRPAIQKLVILGHLVATDPDGKPEAGA